MPVVSMSIRALMGMVQAFETPGIWRRAFNSLTSSSCEMRSGVMRRSTGFSHAGAQSEYHVSLARHSLSGLSRMTVSNIDSGAGSVEVSARPALPKTRVHLGELRDEAVLHLQQALGFTDREARERRGHVEQRAFVERRHELAAELAVNGNRGQHHQARRR
jgi:hypothetical protein